jgi:hypothetical protein
MTRFATKPVTCETSKQNVGHVPTMILSETRGPLLFQVIREGLGSGVRLGARGGTQSNFLVETRSRTRVSQVPDKPPLGLNPRDGTEPWEHSSCLWVQISGVEAYSFLPDDQETDTFFACEITQTDQTTHVNNCAVDIPPIACRPPRGATMSGEQNQGHGCLGGDQQERACRYKEQWADPRNAPARHALTDLRRRVQRNGSGGCY